MASERAGGESKVVGSPAPADTNTAVLGGEPGAEAPPAAGAPPPSRLLRLTNWFWRGGALRAARGAAERSPQSVRDFHRLARANLELGERALDAARPLSVGSAREVATDAFRKSCFWSLAALRRSEDAPESFAELWDATDPVVFDSALGGPDEIDRMRALLTRGTFVSDRKLGRDEQLRAATALGTFARALLARLEQPQRQLDRLWRQRVLRTGLLLLAVLAVAIVLDRAFERRRDAQDLAAGKLWRTSSEATKCYPEQSRCADGTKNIKVLFHTKDEDSPWFELDLAARRSFSEVVVVNRSDCCIDRAIPLIVEVSNDQQRWREVARRDLSFRKWRAKFAPQDARWVRLRVARRGIFHLESVKVLP